MKAKVRFYCGETEHHHTSEVTVDRLTEASVLAALRKNLSGYKNFWVIHFWSLEPEVMTMDFDAGANQDKSEYSPNDSPTSPF